MEPPIAEEGPSSEVDRSRDEEFDPPVDMMVNDFDDERTLDEEEALEQPSDTQNEVSELQRESEMPIEELMKMYGYGDDGKIPDAVEEGGEEGDDFEEDEDDESPEDSELNQLYSEIPADTPQRSEENEKPGTTARLLRYPRLQEKDGDDHDYQPEEDEWRKTIMVGSEYQALIPEGLCRYDDALPYENEDKILWDPNALAEDAVVNFLKKVPGVGGGPNSQITRDDEQALFLLLQCGFNVEEALRRRQMNVVSATDTMSLWSDEECRNFENGLRTYGKDFHLIQQNKVRTRSVGELVQFYYLWKKTERHDVFANELEERNSDLWLTNKFQQPFAGMANTETHPSTSSGLTCTPTPINPNSSHDMYHTPYDWQITKTTLRERGQHLLESGQWSDCKFIVGTEPHQQTFEGHKVFLAMSSPVFEAMFFGGMAEKEGPIHIFDVQPEGFKALLEYIYFDKAELRSFDQACELCYVAKKYMLPHLVQKCTKYIWKDICPDNACRAFEFAKLFEEPDLMEKSLEVIVKKTKEVLAESSFEEVELATVQTVLDQDELNIDSELELFDALQRWAVRECARKGLPPSDGKALRSVLHGTVGKIRFLTLTPSQFAERPAVSQLLSQDEAFAILVNISSPNTSTLSLPLPEGFTSSRVSRKKKPEIPEPVQESQSSTILFTASNPDVALPKMYCIRSPLAGQQPPPIHHSTILDSTVTFTVNRDICILGAQVPTQIEPLEGCVSQGRTSYTELLYAHLLDSNGSRLTYTHFTSRVDYGTFMEISFNRHIFIQRNKVYRVGVVLNKGGSYPTGAYEETAVCDGVVFKFNVGNPNDSVRDGLIHSIVFRLV